MSMRFFAMYSAHPRAHAREGKRPWWNQVRRRRRVELEAQLRDPRRYPLQWQLHR